MKLTAFDLNTCKWEISYQGAKQNCRSTRTSCSFKLFDDGVRNFEILNQSYTTA